MKVTELIIHHTSERKYSYALGVDNVIHVGFDFETVLGALTAAHEHIAAAERKRLGRDGADEPG